MDPRKPLDCLVNGPIAEWTSDRLRLVAALFVGMAERAGRRTVHTIRIRIKSSQTTLAKGS